MARPIEGYAMLGGTQTAALVGDDGSIDWLCLPRFDSGAVFAALLGDESHGRWRIAPTAAAHEPDPVASSRRYRGGSLVLETEFRTATGRARVVDALVHSEERARGGQAPTLVRRVEGIEGTVDFDMELRLRFDYGRIVPWVHRRDGALVAIAGPDAVALQTPVELRGAGSGASVSTTAHFTVGAGDAVPFVLSWHPSHQHPRLGPVDAGELLRGTEQWWDTWLLSCTYDGRYDDAVRRSLVVLKAMSFAPTGGIVAAPTTSLPEALGGSRNWDYRYCWLRDATITLIALTSAGLNEEATAWREWLVRAVAGDVSQLQIMYGVGGERRLSEFEADWLPGYQGAAPVRVGNAAAGQLQLDVYGEVLDALSFARTQHLPHSHATAEEAWSLQQQMLEFLEGAWRQPDDGIWETRGGRQQFVHSKVMCWVAFDRMIGATEAATADSGVSRLTAGAPVDRWRATRAAIHAEVLDRGFDGSRGTFTQFYGSKELDAAVLQIPLVGFLPADDVRVRSTVATVERELMTDGFVLRYSTGDGTGGDGLSGREGAFLACTFWLAQAKVLSGDVAGGRAVFERLLDLRNDVGLLAEEYDPIARRMTGNFPQAFSHVPLVDAALLLDRAEQAQGRGQRQPVRTSRMRHRSDGLTPGPTAR